MTDFTNIQSALRSRAEYLKGLGLAYTRTDGDMMYSAAIYIERLERDKSQLVEQVASYARAYDKAELVLAHMDRQKTELNKTVIERDAAIEQIDGLQRDKTALVNDLAHARNERLRLERTEAGEKIAAITAERDVAKCQRDYIQAELDNMREQRDAYSRNLDAEVQMRNDLRAKCDALTEAYKNAVGAPNAVHGPVFEQVKAQILDEVEKRIVDVANRICAALNAGTL